MKMPGFLIKTGLFLKEQAPNIAIIGGMIAEGFAGYMIYRQTTTLPDILDEQQEKMDELIEEHSEEELELPSVKRDMAAIKAQTFGRVVWHYTPVIAAAVGGTTLIFSGVYGLNKKYIAAVGASAMWQKAYDTVMERAFEKYGEEGVRYLKYGTRREEREVIELDDDGNQVVKKELIEVSDERMPIDGSIYSIIFDETTQLYRDNQGDPLYMESQAKVYERGLNEKYNAGYPVYYDDLVCMFCGADSIYRNDELRNTGWYKRDLDNRDAGDNYIDLHLSRVVVADENGVDKIYLRMDPNVPGIVSLNAGVQRIRRVGGKYLSQV